MTRLSPFDAMCSLLRAKLRSEPLPSDFEEALSGSTRDDIGWVRVASQHRIGPIVGACLEDLDLLGALPADLRFYFQNIRDGNEQQNECFLDELAEIAEALNAVDIEPCLIKGAGSLASGLFPDLSWRFMNDLDLLIPKESMEASWNKLHTLGYRVYENAIEGKVHHHYPPLWHPEKLAYIELHHQVARPRYNKILPAKSLLERSHLLEVSGIGKVRLPHESDLAALLIAHAQIFNSYDRYGIFRLIDLIEFDRLSTGYSLNIETILDRFQQHGWAHQCLAFFGLADRLLGTPAVKDRAIATSAALAIQKSIWLQNHRPMRTLSIVAGWLVRTSQHAWLDGDWRFARRRVVQSITNNKRPPFDSLKQALRDYA